MTGEEKKGSGDKVTNPDAIVEQDLGYEPLAAKKGEGLCSQVRIVVYHFRKRKIDPDNLSIKAVLDGAVSVGILADDTSFEIKEITHKQFKADDEKTYIVFEEVEPGPS